NTYTGTTTLNSGTLTFAANNAGTGAYTLTGGILQGTTALLLPGAVTLNNSAVTLGGSSPIVFTGAMLLNGVNDTLTVANTAPTIITGVVQDGLVAARALTKAGAGTLTLTGANTFTGLTNVLSGVLNVQSATALGATPNQPLLTATTNASTVNPAGTFVAAGATLQLQGGITVNEAIALGGGTLESLTGTNTFGGTINMLAPSTILVDVGQLTVTGQIAGAADL